MNEKYYDTAHRYLEEYVKLRPGDAKGWALMGDGYLNDMQFEKALACYQKTLSLVPQLASPYYLVGYTNFMMKKLPAAREYLNEALNSDPSNVEAHLRLGEISYMENKDAEALKHLLAILFTHPQNAEARFTLAKVYLRQGRFSEANEMLSEIVQRYPDDPRFHYLLADLYRKTGRAKDAEQELSLYTTMQQKQEFQHRFIRHSYIYVE